MQQQLQDVVVKEAASAQKLAAEKKKRPEKFKKISKLGSLRHLQRPMHTRRLCIREIAMTDIVSLREFLQRDNGAFLKNMSWPQNLALHDDRHMQDVLNIFRERTPLKSIRWHTPPKSKRKPPKIVKNSPDVLYRFIFNKGGNRIHGLLRCYRDDYGSFRVHPFIPPSDRGKGFAREAVSAAFGAFAKESGVNTLVAGITTDDSFLAHKELDWRASQRLFKSLGFVFARRTLLISDHHGKHKTELYACPTTKLKLTNPAP